MKENKAHVKELVDAAVANVTGGKDAEALPISDTTLKASCIIDFRVRATDGKGTKPWRNITLTPRS